MLPPASYIESRRKALSKLDLNLTPEFEEVLWPKPREKIIYGGWRAGKSTAGAAEAILFILDRLADIAVNGRGHLRPALIWLVGPDYGQTEQEFNYLNQWATYLQLHTKDPSTPLEGPRHMWLMEDIEIETKSAQYLERLGSVAPDLIIMCEAGQISDEARVWIRGRSMEKRARIIYTGTLEDETAHRQWAWYIELGAEWMNDRTDEHAAYSLPTWANRKLFPDGYDDPEIQKMKDDLYQWTGSDFAFKRRIAGEPVGTPFQVYWQLDTRDLLQEIPRGTRFVRHVGGIDYGTVHPSSLAVVGITDTNIAIVRDVQWTDPKLVRDPGDHTWIKKTHAELSRTYNCWDWHTDPNQRFLARNFEAKAVSGSAGAREARVGLVQARLNSGKLLFDKNGPGVPAAYEEMRKVHRRKTRSGEIVYDRIDDDRTAAIEDSLEGADGQLFLDLPKDGIRARTYERRPFRKQRVRI